MDMVKYLLEHRANVNKKNNNDETSLIIACKQGHITIVKYLVENGADVNKEMNNDRILLYHNFSTCKSGFVIRYSLDSFVGYYKKYIVKRGFTPLFYVCEKGHIDIVKYLVEHGANINKEDKNDWTPLFWACKEGHKDIVECLVEQGVNVNKEDNDGWTPLILACKEGHKDIVKYLVEHGVDLNIEGNNHWTFLMLNACQEGHKNIVGYLLDKNKEKINSLYRRNNKQNIEKGIMDGIYNKYNKSISEQLKFIIDICAPFFFHSSSLITVLMIDYDKEILEIFFNNHLKFFDSYFIINILNYYKNQTPVSDFDFFTLINNDKYKISTEWNENYDEYDSSYYLFNACKSGNKATVKYLLEHGADMTVEDRDGNIALAKACESGNLRLVKYCSTWSRHK